MSKPSYNKIALSYSKLVSQDPIKIDAQYPSVLHFLRKVKDKKILDIGCGDGVLARTLVKRGAEIVAFDASKKQIDLAKKISRGLNIKYLVSSTEFDGKESFDKAFAAMVLVYAKDIAELKNFFDCAYNSLKPGGIFIVLTMFYRKVLLGKNIFNRKFTSLGGNKIKIEFHYGGEKFSSQAHNFNKRDYEKVTKMAGFRSFKWNDLIIKPNSQSKSFWALLKKHKPYKIMILKK